MILPEPVWEFIVQLRFFLVAGFGWGFALARAIYKTKMARK